MDVQAAHELLEWVNRPEIVTFPWSEEHRALIAEAVEVIAEARAHLFETIERIKRERGSAA
jgi:hypothetical protein